MLVLIVALVGWRLASAFHDISPEQDQCSFGSIDNAHYRRLLATARQSRPSLVRMLLSSKEDNLVTLRGWLTGPLKEMATVDEQLAWLHAAMRALGARYIFPRYALHPEAPQGMLLHYEIDVFRVGRVLSSYWVEPINIMLPMRSQSGGWIPHPEGPFRLTFPAVSWFRLHRTGLSSKTFPNCPPVPTAYKDGEK